MNDAFIDQLKKDWQSIEASGGTDFIALRKSLLRRRMTSIALKGLELVITLGAIATGVFMAMTVGGLIGWISAIMLVVVLSVLFLWSYRVWRSAIHWEDRGPEGTVAFGCRNIESSLRIVRIMKVHCWSLLVYVAVLWLLQLSGFIHQAQFLLMYTEISAAVVIVLWWVLRLKQYQALLVELRDEM
ncbi:MAG: hypothetical protein O6945_15065 [Gammaproteobacteria bacterium]|nr:hypothetical protein [Gammaproteobacteria bacterium]